MRCKYSGGDTHHNLYILSLYSKHVYTQETRAIRTVVYIWCLCGYFHLGPNFLTSSHVDVSEQVLHSYSRVPLTTGSGAGVVLQNRQ